MAFHRRDTTKPQAACAVIMQKGKVLAIKSKIEGVTWELPGGKLEPGEDPKTACLRELFEKTTLVGAPGDTVRMFSGWCEAPLKDTHVLYVSYAVFKWKGTPTGTSWRSWEDLLTGSYGAYNQQLCKAYEKFVEKFVPSSRK